MKKIKFHEDICCNCKHVRELKFKTFKNAYYCNIDGKEVNEFDACVENFQLNEDEKEYDFDDI